MTKKFIREECSSSSQHMENLFEILQSFEERISELERSDVSNKEQSFLEETSLEERLEEKVFKRGYAYKDGKDREWVIVCINKNLPTYAQPIYPLLGVVTRADNYLLTDASDYWRTFTFEGKYVVQPVTEVDKDKNLIHSTERLYDPTMIDPAQLPQDQFNVGWVYQDYRTCDYLITFRKDDLLRVEDLSRGHVVTYTTEGIRKYDDYDQIDTLILESGKPYEKWKL